MRGNFDIWGRGSKYLYFFLVSISVIIFHQRDVSYIHNWGILICWFLTFTVASVYAINHLPAHTKAAARELVWRDRYILLATTVVAAVLRFTMLAKFPYNSLGDELRDAGLYALNIHSGAIKDFFGLGAYNGYGNFIPLVSYGFFRVLGNSILIYRLPAAIAGTAAVTMTYLVGRIYRNRLIGVCAAAILCVSVFHLHYSRLEFLIVLDSLLVGLVLLSYRLAKRSYDGVFVLGLVYGLCFHFYAGIRGAIAISAAALFAGLIYEYRRHFTKVLLAAMLVFIGFIIGLGPTYNNIMPKSLQELKEGQAGVAKPIYKHQDFIAMTGGQKASYMAQLYATSLLVYISHPTNDMHIDYHVPLLPLPVAPFLVVGIGTLALTGGSRLLLALLFFFPLTNEVYVNHAGSDHRMLSILPILALICAIGMEAAVVPFRKDWGRALITVFLAVYCVYWVKFFFVVRPSDNLYQFRGGKDYPFQKILEAARTDPAHSIYILNDPQNYMLPQYREKRMFYLAHKYSEVLDEQTFVDKIRREGSSTNVSFYSLQQIDGLTDVIYETYVTDCGVATLLPRYDCPLKTLDRPYYYYKIIPRPQ